MTDYLFTTKQPSKFICDEPISKKDIFIKKATELFDNEFDYSLVTDFDRQDEKVKIICRKHGIFDQSTHSHLMGSKGCKQCSDLSRAFTTAEFIENARGIHGTKYNYARVEYKNLLTKVVIICDKHGEFLQSPKSHLGGHGCTKCGFDSVSTTLFDFIERSAIKHENKYDYRDVKFNRLSDKITIYCPDHGAFRQIAGIHLDGSGCQKCGKERTHTSRRSSIEEFIYKATKIHGDRYDYSTSIYVASSPKITIRCKVHGEFTQNRKDHLSGRGCRKCKQEPYRIKSLNNFLEKSIEIHDGKYDYSKVQFVSIHIPVIIICPNHGEFRQLPHKHYSGSGCKKCKESKGERRIRLYLEKHNISYTIQQSFSECKDTRLLLFDFYLPKYNICVEYDGEYHFYPIRRGSQTPEDAERNLARRKYLDEIKTKFCQIKCIKLIRISYHDFNSIEIILNDALGINNTALIKDKNSEYFSK